MKIILRSLSVFLIIATFVPALSVLAVEVTNDINDQGVYNDTNRRNAVTNDTGESIKLANPLGDINSFPELIKAILDAAFIIGLPIAVLFIVFAGFRFVWARGNTTELAKAKTNLLYTIIGIAVFFGAWLITNVIVGTLRTLNIDI